MHTRKQKKTFSLPLRSSSIHFNDDKAMRMKKKYLLKLFLKVFHTWDKLSSLKRDIEVLVFV